MHPAKRNLSNHLLMLCELNTYQVCLFLSARTVYIGLIDLYVLYTGPKNHTVTQDNVHCFKTKYLEKTDLKR